MRTIIGIAFLSSFGCVHLALGSESTLTDKNALVDVSPTYISVFDGRKDLNAVPMRTAMWSFFGMVSDYGSERSEAGEDILVNRLGLTDDLAKAVAQYMINSYAQYQVTAQLQLQRNCSRKSNLNSRSSLAAELTEIDRQLEIAQEIHISNLSQVLNDSEIADVQEWVNLNIRRKLQVQTIDYATYFEAENIDHRQVIARMCAKQLGNLHN